MKDVRVFLLIMLGSCAQYFSSLIVFQAIHCGVAIAKNIKTLCNFFLINF